MTIAGALVVVPGCGGRTGLVIFDDGVASSVSAHASATTSSLAGTGASTRSSASSTSTPFAAMPIEPLDGGPDGAWGIGWCGGLESGPQCAPPVPLFVLPKPADPIGGGRAGIVGSWVDCQYYACIPDAGCVTCVCATDAVLGAAWSCY
jgi:hypothetical protein